MRRLLVLGIVLTVIGAGLYIVSPMRAAWVLREAIRTSDTKTIETRVLWPQVRASLRQSISTSQQLLPEATSAGAAIRPTLWQRVKWTFGSSMLDRFLETYITPDGLPKLYAYRKTWDSKVKRRPDDATLPTGERIRRFYRRIVRAEFSSPTQFLIEIRARDATRRSYLGVLELHGMEWKLASLQIKVDGGSPAKTAPTTTGKVTDKAATGRTTDMASSSSPTAAPPQRPLPLMSALPGTTTGR